MQPSTTGRALPESGRVEAFSDGVFAIALTLLVLDLVVPESRGDFAHDLGHHWQSYVAYLGAFLTISAVWINHHDAFTRVKAVDPRLMVINLGVLLIASIMPFPTAVISSAMQHGNRHDQIVAVAVYAGVGVLLALSWNGLYYYLARTPKLLVDPADVEYMRAGRRRSVVTLVLFPVAALLAFIEPVIALVAFLAVAVFFIGAIVHAEGN
jgi:uncharacterized membrane protein